MSVITSNQSSNGIKPATSSTTTAVSSSSSFSSSTSSSSTSYLSLTALFYMVLLAIQFGIQPIVTRKYTSPNIIRSTVVLVQEVSKFIIASTMLLLSGDAKKSFQGWTIRSWINVAIIPAGLYSVQNMAAITAYQNLDAMTYNVLNQTKTLSAALCCYFVMGTKQSAVQIFALFILLLSALVIEGIVTINSIGNIIYTVLSFNNSDPDNSNKTSPNYDTRHYTHGVAPILLASFISGLAGALSQKNLQGSNSRNIYLFSMELCIASVILLTGSLLVSNDGQLITTKGFWYAWEWSTAIPIMTNSMGGIIVGLVTKYAGSVQKGFALIFGILLSGIIQVVVHSDKSVTPQQWIGGLLAAISLYLHASHPPPRKLSTTTSAAAAATIEKTLKKD